jgi:hypothetical protein
MRGGEVKGWGDSGGNLCRKSNNSNGICFEAARGKKKGWGVGGECSSIVTLRRAL